MVPRNSAPYFDFCQVAFITTVAANIVTVCTLMCASNGSYITVESGGAYWLSSVIDRMGGGGGCPCWQRAAPSQLCMRFSPLCRCKGLTIHTTSIVFTFFSFYKYAG